MKNELICAFTGHRPQYFSFGYNEKCTEFELLYNHLKNEIAHYYEKGVTTFLSGMALGADLWCATIVIEMKKKYKNVKLVCVIPCDNQAEKWSSIHIKRYKAILKKADEIVYTGHDYTNDCMLIRNRFLVDNSDCLFAVYDEDHSNPRSGTGYTVRYARRKDKEVIIVDPSKLNY